MLWRMPADLDRQRIGMFTAMASPALLAKPALAASVRVSAQHGAQKLPLIRKGVNAISCRVARRSQGRLTHSACGNCGNYNKRVTGHAVGLVDGPHFHIAAGCVVECWQTACTWHPRGHLGTR